MKIWAHRGCSQLYPENTLTAFTQAAGIKGLAGIELDIQLSRDEYIVVFHDEWLDRTTDGIGELRNYTLSELKNYGLMLVVEKIERIPTIDEVLDLLEHNMKKGIN